MNPVPNQKSIIINKTTPPESKYFKIDQDLFFCAASRLNKAGLLVYMYIMSLVPDTWDGQINKTNKRVGAYNLSTKDMADLTHSNQKNMQRGLEELIEKGYLIYKEKDLIYQFIDMLPCDRIQTEQEHNTVITYEEQLRNSINDLQQQRDQQLKEIAKENVLNEKKHTEEEFAKQAKEKGYDWW